MSLVEDVQMFLAGRAIVDIPMSGLPNDWPSVQRVVHEGSARLVIITEDGGFEPETPSFAGIGDSAMEEPAVQVRVRGAKGEGVEAEAKMLEIRDALHGRVREAVGYTNYMRVKAQSGVLYIGMDAKERPEFTLSFRARKSIELVS